MTVIKPNITLVDRRGVGWRTAPGFQDEEPNRPGWLLLRSASGEELGYAEVLDRYGFTRADGDNFLRGRIDAAPKPLGYCANCVERCEGLHGPCFDEVVGCTEELPDWGDRP